MSPDCGLFEKLCAEIGIACEIACRAPNTCNYFCACHQGKMPVKDVVATQDKLPVNFVVPLFRCMRFGGSE